ncbi:MAG TPA: hypothetical protein VE054_12450 [Blattabacteriaceae bacterium]|nr:hypothetical protein [Blattabacteriaceae bacterium]
MLIEGIGGGAQSAPIADIADIAGIARDRKTKAYRGSTQMNADQEWGWKAEVHAILGWLGRQWDTKGGGRR